MQPSMYFSLFSSMHSRMLDISPDFAMAGAWLETSLKCWSIQQNAGDLAAMRLRNDQVTLSLKLVVIYFYLVRFLCQLSVITFVALLQRYLAKLTHFIFCYKHMTNISVKLLFHNRRCYGSTVFTSLRCRGCIK